MQRPPLASVADARTAGRTGGSLTPERSALQVLTYLQGHQDGAWENEIASVFGLSRPTAAGLLAALCEEGFASHDADGVYRAIHRSMLAVPVVARELSLAALADELFARTHKRSYIGVLDGGALEIVEVRGRQGLPKLPGMGDRISDIAHASAMGKVVLSLMRPAAVERYLQRPLRTVAPATIVDPSIIREQLDRARRDGYATDVEEIASDFCCVAAPVFDREGGLRAVAGISMSLRAFQESLDTLQRAVREVACTKLTIAPARPMRSVPGTAEVAVPAGRPRRTALS